MAKSCIGPRCHQQRSRSNTPGTCPTPDAQLRLASRGWLQVHAWPTNLTCPEKSGDCKEKIFLKLCALPAGNSDPPASEQPSPEAGPTAPRFAAPGSPGLCALTSGHGRGHCRALTWHLLLTVGVLAVFTWGFQTSFRKEEESKKIKNKKHPIMQNKLRTGRRAWDPTPPLLYEFSEQPRALQIYGGASRLRQVPPPDHLEVN